MSLKTSADRANQAFVLDLMEKRRGGFYQAPSYTTNIARQYNCGVTATSVGNEGTQSAVANSPSVSGPTALANGNDADTVLNGGGRQGGNRAESWQSNRGMVSAGVTGSAGPADLAEHDDLCLLPHGLSRSPSREWFSRARLDLGQ
ncbi:hypothetical protein [Sphingomonas sanguinis]|uniref:hypothetical protein n=1 Tax=Sphingomonas sanguinis TaxID=33051 RepID=UPI00128FC5E4|nr:hypothetical protein [Sphingomonas sanguinis]